MLNNKVKNFLRSNFKLLFKIKEQSNKNDVIEIIKKIILMLENSGKKVDSEITILNKDNELLFLVECKISNLSKRVKFMEEFFNCVKDVEELKIDSILVNEFKQILTQCFIENWKLIEYPKYMTDANFI
jgi:hypothetical protein